MLTVKGAGVEQDPHGQPITRRGYGRTRSTRTDNYKAWMWKKKIHTDGQLQGVGVEEQEPINRQLQGVGVEEQEPHGQTTTSVCVEEQEPHKQTTTRRVCGRTRATRTDNYKAWM